MNEARFTTRFNKWVKHEFPFISAAFELKLTKKRSIPFTAVKPHQRDALRAVANRLIYKIPDEGLSQKPFDVVFLADSIGYVVIMFYYRGCRKFYIITIQKWEQTEQTCGRKSCTEDMAKAICETIGELR
jgi:penicillin-binding protein-related factor A (putative recombinase)